MAAVQLAPPLVHRPSMDRSSSFESSRRQFTSTYDRSTSPIPRQTYSPSPLGSNPHASHSHSRTNSNASSPYNQPFSTNYFTQPNFHPHAHPNFPHTPPLQAHTGAQIAWTASPIPATALYSANMGQGGPSTAAAGAGTGFTYPGQVFHQGFQQSQADFAAWAHAAAYQHMVMASVQQQQQQQQQQHQQHQQQQQQEFLVGSYGEEEHRRRTNSGPVNPQPQVQHPYQRRQSLDDRTSPPVISTLLQQPRSVSDKHPQQPQAQAGGFHPYKRNPGPTHRTSKESLRTNQQPSVLPRSRSQPSLSTAASGQSEGRAAALVREHQRTPSLDSSLSGSTVQAVPRPSMADGGRRDSSSTERGRKISMPPTQPITPTSIPVQAAAPAPTPTPTRISAPLQSGPIASATNSQPRPSPLTSTLPSTPADKPKPANVSTSGGLKSRLAKALHKDKVARDTKSSMPPPPTPPTPPTPSKSFAHTSPSESSTRSGTPPRTPPHPHPSPQEDSFHPQPPSAPFAVIHRMGSEVSLAETGRTERVQDEATEKKGKKGLFRMKNMSTDNISLSSTVSSASMMIRKMGSIGKLARRNSLMGISKIFKDKPKDEDAALPETDGVVLSKKDKKEKEKREKEEKKKAKAQQKGKGDPAPTAIVRASAEADDDDRALAGLSPAAKLARQHTLKSKADEAKRLSQITDEQGQQGTGEPTWDNNTVTRPSTLPSLGSVLPPTNHAQHAGPSNPPPAPTSTPAPGPEVMLVQPRNTSAATVHHAVNVSEAEYDSEDDSSDGEDMEELAYRLKGSKMSDEADKEFRSIWGNSYIDKRAVPKKGILKAASFYDDTPKPSRSGSATGTRGGGVLAEISPNGATSPTPTPAPTPGPKSKSVTLDPKPQTQTHLPPTSLDFDFSFDTPSPSLDLHHPQANSSAHSLPSSPSAKPGPGLAVRSMTSPVPPRRILWAPDCAVYTTYDAGTYDRRSEPATCNRLTPELALSIKQELNAFKLEMPVHPASRKHTHYFA